MNKFSISKKILAVVVAFTVSMSVTLISYTSSNGKTNVPVGFANNTPIFTTKASSCEYYYNQILEHQPIIKFTYVMEDAPTKAAYKIFNKYAFLDQGDDFTLIGDYVRYSMYDGYKASCSYHQENSQYYCTFTFNSSYKTTLLQEKAFDRKLLKVMKSLKLSGKTDYQKVKIIYDYICAKVTYDTKHSSNYSIKYTAYGALIKGTASCQGYATLFYRMCKEAKVPVRIITGTGNNGKHAWNIVRLKGKYYNVDPSWDAGKKKYVYFLKSNGSFHDHIRNKEYKTIAFTNSHPMSKTNYK